MPSTEEVQFISMWRDCAVDGYVDHSTFSCWRVGNSFRFSTRCYMYSTPYASKHGKFWSLNPRGADLIATAEAVGFDPDAIDGEPEPAECSECGGTKRVPVLGAFTNPCPACSKAPVVLTHDVAPVDEQPPPGSTHFVRNTKRDGYIVKFGKHAGEPLSQVPSPYLRWMLAMSFPSETITIIKYERHRRQLRYEHIRQRSTGRIASPAVSLMSTKIDTNPPGLGEN